MNKSRMKAKNLRIGMNVRFREAKHDLTYKIIGRDPQMNRTRFVVGRDKDEDGYKIIIHYVHETELERVWTKDRLSFQVS